VLIKGQHSGLRDAQLVDGAHRLDQQPEVAVLQYAPGAGAAGAGIHGSPAL